MLTKAKAAEKWQVSYKKLGGKLQFDWMGLVQQFIDMLMEQCNSVEDGKALAKAHPAAAELMYVFKLGRTTDLKLKDRKLVAQAGVQQFNATKLADLKAVVNE